MEIMDGNDPDLPAQEIVFDPRSRTPEKMGSLLHHFQLAQFQFILEVLGCLNLSEYLGPTLRGGKDPPSSLPGE
jgi:hypothetical protein